MPIGKEIKISVDDSPLNKLRQQVEKIGTDMIRRSREFTTSGAEAINYIEKEIQLLERRNKIQDEYSRSRLERAFATGQISEQDYQTNLGKLEAKTAERDLVPQLLRELIQTVETTSREEIRTDREGTEEALRRSHTLSQLAPEGDPIRNLIETLQNEMLGDDEEPAEDAETKEKGKGKSRWRKRLEKADQFLAGLARQENEYTAISAGIGVLSEGLGVLSGRLVGSAGRLESALVDRAVLRGTSINAEAANIGAFQSFSGRIGLTGGQQAMASAQYARAFGGIVSDQQTMNLLSAQRRLGLDQGQINQLLGIGRYDITATGGATGADRTLSIFRQYLRDSGQNIARLPEIMSAYASASEYILSNVSNRVDQGQLAANVSAIGRATGQTGIGLQTTAGAIQGLASSTNPVVKSLMMRAFSQINPGASFFDLQAMMESPLENLDSMSNFFSSIRQMTGGGEMYRQALFSTFGGQLSRTRIKEILDEGGDFTDLAAEAKKFREITPEDFTTQIDGFVGAIEKSNARIESKFEEYGILVVQQMDRLISSIDKLVNSLTGEEVQKRKESRKRIEKELKEEAPSVLYGPIKTF